MKSCNLVVDRLLPPPPPSQGQPAAESVVVNERSRFCSGDVVTPGHPLWPLRYSLVEYVLAAQPHTLKSMLSCFHMRLQGPSGMDVHYQWKECQKHPRKQLTRAHVRRWSQAWRCSEIVCAIPPTQLLTQVVDTFY